MLGLARGDDNAVAGRHGLSKVIEWQRKIRMDGAWSIKGVIGRDLAEKGSKVHRMRRRAIGGCQICVL